MKLLGGQVPSKVLEEQGYELMALSDQAIEKALERINAHDKESMSAASQQFLDTVGKAASEELKAKEDKVLVTSMRFAFDEDLGEIRTQWKNPETGELESSYTISDADARKKKLQDAWEAMDEKLRDEFLVFAYRWGKIPMLPRSALAVTYAMRCATDVVNFTSEVKYHAERGLKRRSRIVQESAGGAELLQQFLEALALHADAQIATSGIDGPEEPETTSKTWVRKT